MLIVLSPSKTLDESQFDGNVAFGTPELLSETKLLVGELQKLSQPKLTTLLGVSAKLGEVNYARYRAFAFPFKATTSKPAIWMFKGDVYDDISPNDYTTAQLTFAQKHVRILSGLYGAIRPLDYILPYRLEMKTKLKTDRGTDLYSFWGARVAELLEKSMRKNKDSMLLNLASQEYFKVLSRGLSSCHVLTPVFKEKKGKELKVVALFAKQARGAMANYVIKNKITNSSDLYDFDARGYRYQPKLSSASELVFVR